MLIIFIIMLRLTSRSLFKQLQNSCSYRIRDWKLPASEVDSAGLMGYFDSRHETYLTLSQKLSEITPTSLYNGLDEWSRELLVTLSVDLGCNFATSIIIATFAIKTLFLIPTLQAQIQGLRMKQIRSLSDIYKDRMKTAQMTNNKILMAQASYEFKTGMKKRGINTLIPMVNMLQIPLLVTWFLSLRYMSNLPEVYPQLLNQGFLWFTDLSTYDPYFVLPVLAACCTSLSIARSPNLSRNNMSMPFLAPYVKYFKYIPFLSLAFTGFFPSSITLYWFSLSAYQLMVTQMMYSTFIQKKFGLIGEDRKKKVKFDEAIFVEEKQTSQQIMKAASKPQLIIDQIKKKNEEAINLQVSEVKVSSKRTSKKKRSDDVV